MYKLYFTKDAKKDAKLLKAAKLQRKIEAILLLLQEDPWQSPPPFKKLLGDLAGCYSRRINLQHRIFYEIDEKNKRIKILRMWSHYGD